MPTLHTSYSSYVCTVQMSISNMKSEHLRGMSKCQKLRTWRRLLRQQLPFSKGEGEPSTCVLFVVCMCVILGSCECTCPKAIAIPCYMQIYVVPNCAPSILLTQAKAQILCSKNSWVSDEFSPSFSRQIVKGRTLMPKPRIFLFTNEELPEGATDPGYKCACARMPGWMCVRFLQL